MSALSARLLVSKSISGARSEGPQRVQSDAVSASSARSAPPLCYGLEGAISFGNKAEKHGSVWCDGGVITTGVSPGPVSRSYHPAPNSETFVEQHRCAADRSFPSMLVVLPLGMSLAGIPV